MELFLVKFYLLLVFIILLILTIFLALQIKLKQNLENKFSSLTQEVKETDQTYQRQFKLGQIYLRKKIYNKAIEEFRSCFNNWDNNDRLGLASLLNTLGFTYYQLKEYDVSIYYYRKALDITPDYLTSLTNLAYLYKDQGQLNNLDRIYQRLNHLAPNNKKTKELGEYLVKRLVKSE